MCAPGTEDRAVSRAYMVPSSKAGSQGAKQTNNVFARRHDSTTVKGKYRGRAQRRGKRAEKVAKLT